MKNNLTFTMIKPDAMENGYAGDILSLILKSRFHISALKLIHLTKNQAISFYNIHRKKPFFEELRQTSRDLRVSDQVSDGSRDVCPKSSKSGRSISLFS